MEVLFFVGSKTPHLSLSTPLGSSVAKCTKNRLKVGRHLETTLVSLSKNTDVLLQTVLYNIAICYVVVEESRAEVFGASH